MNRNDLQRLAGIRIREAKALFKAGEYSGAYYLAGYAVECALKACIAKETLKHDFPDKDRANKSYVHSPSELIKVAELYRDLQMDGATNPALDANWNVVTKWSERSRYETWSRSEAKALIEAVSRKGNGVLPWIRRRW
jgi:HEPN domain-containing protein